MTTWFYEASGKSEGPVSETELSAMLANGKLPPTTKVWNETFGQEWRTASATSLLGNPPTARSAASQPMGPPPVNRSDAAATSSYMPTNANLIAAIPVLVIVADLVAIAGGANPLAHPVSTGISMWAAILSFFFAWRDSKRAALAGLNPHGRAIAPFVLLTPIGYFLRRKAVTSLPLTPLWLWLAAVIVYVIFSGAMYG